MLDSHLAVPSKLLPRQASSSPVVILVVAVVEVCDVVTEVVSEVVSVVVLLSEVLGVVVVCVVVGVVAHDSSRPGQHVFVMTHVGPH